MQNKEDSVSDLPKKEFKISARVFYTKKNEVILRFVPIAFGFNTIEEARLYILEKYRAIESVSGTEFKGYGLLLDTYLKISEYKPK